MLDGSVLVLVTVLIVTAAFSFTHKEDDPHAWDLHGSMTQAYILLGVLALISMAVLFKNLVDALVR